MIAKSPIFDRRWGFLLKNNQPYRAPGGQFSLRNLVKVVAGALALADAVRAVGTAHELEGLVVAGAVNEQPLGVE